jgi:hypothetical protein
MLSLGLDVGGANTKAVLLKDGEVEKHWLEYIPLWKSKADLERFLKALANSTRVDIVGATMTAELCDAFESKREGVVEMVETVCEAFGDRCFFISLDGTLLKREEALASPEKLAAANWVASSLLVGRRFPDCLLIDVGSTTTDIIPLKAGKPSPRGRTDFQRLRAGELVYTGMLRTPLPCVRSELRLGEGKLRLAAENFSIMGDVYRVLGMLDEDDYLCETPDGRGKDRRSCMGRIARAFCSELDEMGEASVLGAARAFYAKQVELVARAIGRVASSHCMTKTVGCGMGRRVIAKRAAQVLGLEFIDLATVYGEVAALMTPAFAVGLLAAEVAEVGRGR